MTVQTHPTTQVPARIPNIPVRATVTNWCALSGMSRSATYEALGRGDLRAVKVGSRTLIDVAPGLQWLDGLPPATVRPHDAKRPPAPLPHAAA